MKLEKEQITSKQLLFSIACFVQSAALIASFSTSVTKQESWIAVISGYIISLPVIGMYILLSKSYPGKSIIGINIEIFGNIIGRCISLLYIFFFFSLAFLNTHIVGGFVSSSVLPDTPNIIVLAMFIYVCVYAARCGAENMSRFCFVFIGITIMIVFITTLFLIKDMKPTNLLPVFSLPLKKYIQSTHTMAALPFCEIFTFFMLFPYVSHPKKVGRALLGGMTIGATTMLVVILRDIMVLGPSIGYFSSPDYQAIRIIEVGKIFTRLEILYAISLLMLMFFKISILLFAVTKGIAEVMNLHSHKMLIPVIGVLAIISSFKVFDSIAEHAYWGENIAAIYSSFFEVLLPVITLITMVIKKKLLPLKDKA